MTSSRTRKRFLTWSPPVSQLPIGAERAKRTDGSISAQEEGRGVAGEVASCPGRGLEGSDGPRPPLLTGSSSDSRDVASLAEISLGDDVRRGPGSMPTGSVSGEQSSARDFDLLRLVPITVGMSCQSGRISSGRDCRLYGCGRHCRDW